MTNSDINKVIKYLESKDKDNPVSQALLTKLKNKNLMLGVKTAIVQRNINNKILNKILFGGLNEQKTKKS